jgi:hypothetical protein
VSDERRKTTGMQAEPKSIKVVRYDASERLEVGQCRLLVEEVTLDVLVSRAKPCLRLRNLRAHAKGKGIYMMANKRISLH